MYSYVLKSCTIILRKSGVTLLSSFNISAKSHAFTEIQLKTRYVQHNFCNSANVYSVAQIEKTLEKTSKDAEQLKELLKDSKMDKVYKLIQYELEYMKYSGSNVPSYIRPKEWINLIKLPSVTQRRKYIQFLFINEIKNINKKIKDQETKEKNLQNLKEQFATCPSGLEYGFGKNNMFLRIYDKTMDYFYNYKMVMSILYEPTIVFDCGFDREMSNLELKNCAKQMTICLAKNRIHKSPASIYLCNAHKTNKLLEYLTQMIPSLYEHQCPLQITSQSYLDMFDKNKLIYLTPHCREEMKYYDPDKIYILGALVDKRNPQPFTLAKAKREGIKMQRLPLDKYFTWNSGSNKSLTLNQVLCILLDLKVTQDWSTALINNVPPRKLRLTGYETTSDTQFHNINK